MSKYSEMTDEQYFAAQNEFMEKYKAPACEPIEVLDLVMRREFAEAILSGEKKVEVRNGSEHYFNRLTDKKVNQWMTNIVMSQVWIWSLSMSLCVQQDLY